MGLITQMFSGLGVRFELLATEIDADYFDKMKKKNKNYKKLTYCVFTQNILTQKDNFFITKIVINIKIKYCNEREENNFSSRPSGNFPQPEKKKNNFFRKHINY